MAEAELAAAKESNAALQAQLAQLQKDTASSVSVKTLSDALNNRATAKVLPLIALPVDGEAPQEVFAPIHAYPGSALQVGPTMVEFLLKSRLIWPLSSLTPAALKQQQQLFKLVAPSGTNDKDLEKVEAALAIYMAKDEYISLGDWHFSYQLLIVGVKMLFEK
jgi:hypothetical protein